MRCLILSTDTIRALGPPVFPMHMDGLGSLSIPSSLSLLVSFFLSLSHFAAVREKKEQWFVCDASDVRMLWF